MAEYLSREWSSVTFEPADGPPVEIGDISLIYLTEVGGARVAFVQTFLDEVHQLANTLQTGRVGRLTIRRREGADPDDRRSIPVGVLTCISHVARPKAAVIKTYVVTEIAPAAPPAA